MMNYLDFGFLNQGISSIITGSKSEDKQPEQKKKEVEKKVSKEPKKDEINLNMKIYLPPPHYVSSFTVGNSPVVRYIFVHGTPIHFFLMSKPRIHIKDSNRVINYFAEFDAEDYLYKLRTGSVGNEKQNEEQNSNFIKDSENDLDTTQGKTKEFSDNRARMYMIHPLYANDMLTEYRASCHKAQRFWELSFSLHTKIREKKITDPFAISEITSSICHQHEILRQSKEGTETIFQMESMKLVELIMSERIIDERKMEELINRIDSPFRTYYSKFLKDKSDRESLPKYRRETINNNNNNNNNNNSLFVNPFNSIEKGAQELSLKKTQTSKKKE